MVFLIHTLVVVSIIYWFSAVVAEIVFRSRRERQLHHAVRVALGYVVSVAWFTASFKFVSPVIGWLSGLSLLFLYGKLYSRESWRAFFAAMKPLWKSYVRSFLWCLVAANIFLVPLHLSQTYGPFSEGGGDISIYADVAKYLADHNRPAYGKGNVGRQISMYLVNPFAGFVDNNESLSHFDESLGNPPVGNHGEYRNALAERWPPGWFVPTAHWTFLGGQTNYPVYFGILCFQYAIMVFCIWALFLSYGRLAAVVAAIALFASHGLVSVYYNHYFPQSISLMVCAIVLALLPKIRVLSFAGLRTYGVCAAIVTTSYLLFYSVIFFLPFIGLRDWSHSQVPAGGSLVGNGKALQGDESSGHWQQAALSRWFPIATFVGIILLWTILDTVSNLGLVRGLLQNVMASVLGKGSLALDRPLYLGDAIPVFSPQWFAFFFGSLSQQHFSPFINVPPSVTGIVQLANFFGILLFCLSFIVSLCLLWIVAKELTTGESTRRLVVFTLVLYFVSVGILVIHQLVAQSSLYTQAKGAQNVLVVLYVCMLLPFGAAYKLHRDGYRMRWIKIIALPYAISGSGFLIGLGVLRVLYAVMLGCGLGRSTVLESSFFARAAEILDADREAYVLIEPRTSADVYLNIQPFTEARMIPTRYLGLKSVKSVFSGSRWLRHDVDMNKLGSDYLNVRDLPHLWSLSAKKVGTRGFGEGFEGGKYEWEKERLVEVKEPRLLLFGYDYEAFYGERARSSRSEDKGWFTFFRNGSALMVLPAHGETKRIELKLQPRDSVNFGPMVKEVRSWTDTATLAKRFLQGIDTLGGFITLRYEVPAAGEAKIVALVRYWGEFWMNVRIDGAELKPPEDTPALQKPAKIELKGTIEVFPEQVKAGGQVIGEWKGVEPSNAEDWVGVFPVGGNDASRVVFAFTGGEKDGSVQLTLPATTKPGQYELRLYSKGGWDKITASKKFEILP